MNTLEELKKKTLELRKAHDSLAPTMQFHLSEVNGLAKKENREATETDAIQYLKKAASKLREDQYANPKELQIIEELLPAMATEEEVQAFIEAKEAEGLDTSNKGIMMKEIKNKFGSLVDMKMASKLL